MKMKYFRKKITKGILVLFAIIATTIYGINVIKAEITYTNLAEAAPSTGVVDRVTLQLYKCSKTSLASLDVTAYNPTKKVWNDDDEVYEYIPKYANVDVDTDTGLATVCYLAYANNLIDFSNLEITDSSNNVDPGSVILLFNKLSYTGYEGNSIVSTLSYRIHFNNENLTPIPDQSTNKVAYYEKDWYVEDRAFSIDSNNTQADNIYVSADSGTHEPVKKNQSLACQLFKVNSSATAGATLSFYL